MFWVSVVKPVQFRPINGLIEPIETNFVIRADGEPLGIFLSGLEWNLIPLEVMEKIEKTH